MTQPANAHYSGLQKTLHWLVAILILWQFTSHFIIDTLPEGSPTQNGFKASHGLSGMLILLLMFVRLLVRLRKGVPELPDTMLVWQHSAAKFAHPVLYALIFGQTISGIMAGAAGIKAAGAVHGILSVSLVAFILVHVAAAIQHMLKGDGIGSRMFRRPGA
jgi:cytochrome b561